MESRKWDIFFALLKFKRWFRFFQYLFLFLFFAISIYYFTNKQIHYVRKEWTMYNAGPFSSEYTLDTGKIYYVSWDNSNCDIKKMIVNGEDNYFQNLYVNWPFFWKAWYGSHWPNIYLDRGFIAKVNFPTTIEIKMEMYSRNPFDWMTMFEKIRVIEISKIDSSKFLDLEKIKDANMEGKYGL